MAGFSVVMPSGGDLPQQLSMGGAGLDALAPHADFFVKQTRKGCVQEMMGCEAKTEFKIATMGNQQADVLYALEESSFLQRFLISPIREWNMNVTQGGAPGGPMIAQFFRPLRCGIGPMKCCCYQEVMHKDALGVPIGSTTEGQYCFVPKFTITDAQGNPEYLLSQPTCVGGACVDIFAEGLCNCRVPFYVFPLTAEAVKGQEVGRIVKVWAGLGTELFSDADKFELVFPAGAKPDTKARLLGSLFLLNQLFFETKG
mmetsp:Transcript_42463/g.96668  ORF Transcript_42463/g.96668 Transcript_42463/m.96668 type:complete len:257 (+) Transcript_42463:95-865(+)|eukprot:CAMPEP_0180139842 /NCGR_PEP_ID=MMETSP0986-20121125/13806_1 /TAXON_ID=697907 /ORGANISM="non described non described, Strain CCMP2293" /LENGTH=256 /DNA_ID=CAMNT_0022082087 /DNA_START=79 /DNA_END=852 /DNA_ORIENTATION=-